MCRLLLVLLRAGTPLVEATQPVLRLRVALGRRLADPMKRLGVVLLDPATVRITLAELRLCLAIARLGRDAQPARGLRQVGGSERARVDELGEAAGRGSLALLGRRGVPPPRLGEAAGTPIPFS